MNYCQTHGFKAIKKIIPDRGNSYEICYICFKLDIHKKLGYKTYHPQVQKFHESNARIKVCYAPARTTKSYSAAFDMLPCCLLRNTLCWIVGPSYQLAEKEFRVIHKELVINRHKLNLPRPVICHTNPATGRLYIKWPWGAAAECKSADRLDSLLGEAVDYVIYSEASQLKREVRERYVSERCITKKGIELIPSTPATGAEWMQDLCVMGQDEKYKDEIESFHWDISANPLYPIEEFERAKKLYGEDSPVFREQYLGEWVFYGGRVFNNFNADVHVIKPFTIPYHWNRFAGIDFGHRDPFVVLWGAVGPSNEIYIYREYYSTEGKGIRDHARKIKALSEGENIKLCVGDPQAAQSISDLCAEGIPCTRANNDISAGRLKVLEYLEISKYGEKPFPLKDITVPQGRTQWPRLYFFDTCIETLREIKYYRFRKSRGIEGEKETTEGDDHAMSALRYMIMTRPSPSKFKKFIPRHSVWGIREQIKEKRIITELGVTV